MIFSRKPGVAHGHLCAGQVLGVRLAMLGCTRLGIEQPRGKDRKRLVTFVEIDRCATDAIGVVTGCRLGKRALKFRDWGKMAATFVDLETRRAIRIAARESSKDLARQLHPEIENKNLQQMAAYREMSDEDLFDEQWVQVTLDAKEFPGYKGERVACPNAEKESTTTGSWCATGRRSASPVRHRKSATTSRSPPRKSPKTKNAVRKREEPTSFGVCPFLQLEFRADFTMAGAKAPAILALCRRRLKSCPDTKRKAPSWTNPLFSSLFSGSLYGLVCAQDRCLIEMLSQNLCPDGQSL